MVTAIKISSGFNSACKLCVSVLKDGEYIVITSYSIHYTKLYDGTGAFKNNAAMKGFVLPTPVHPVV